MLKSVSVTLYKLQMKFELFDVQKLQLKEAITANDIAHDALDAFHYFICSITFQYRLITVL